MPFTEFCHSVHHISIGIFIAIHGDLYKTVTVMQHSIKQMGINDVKKHIMLTLKYVHLQFKRKFVPEPSVPSWETPNPSENDYCQPCTPQFLFLDDNS